MDDLKTELDAITDRLAQLAKRVHALKPLSTAEMDLLAAYMGEVAHHGYQIANDLADAGEKAVPDLDVEADATHAANVFAAAEGFANHTTKALRRIPRERP
ncbi:hypothetical protein GCM10023196_036540 [Actinoallomurus vinaceus]|uniref:Uncharacterized protein n=1 Tax=Actinoallomurus vinaceus TaxID=1080074 RepID=A0ABP8UAL9_9ACTN